MITDQNFNDIETTDICLETMLEGLLHFLFESDGMLLRESDKSDTIILHSLINFVLHHRDI